MWIGRSFFPVGLALAVFLGGCIGEDPSGSESERVFPRLSITYPGKDPALNAGLQAMKRIRTHSMRWRCETTCSRVDSAGVDSLLLPIGEGHGARGEIILRYSPTEPRAILRPFLRRNGRRVAGAESAITWLSGDSLVLPGGSDTLLLSWFDAGGTEVCLRQAWQGGGRDFCPFGPPAERDFEGAPMPGTLADTLMAALEGEWHRVAVTFIGGYPSVLDSTTAWNFAPQVLRITSRVGLAGHPDSLRRDTLLRFEAGRLEARLPAWEGGDLKPWGWAKLGLSSELLTFSDQMGTHGPFTDRTVFYARGSVLARLRGSEGGPLPSPRPRPLPRQVSAGR